MRSSDDLDRMLDDALVIYCEVEPRRGLEARVLHRARAPRRRWGWLVLVPLLGALLLAIKFESPSIPPPPAIRPVVLAEAPKSLDVPATASRHRTRIVSQREQLPRKNVFPTPTPLTPEEQAMVLFASRSPKVAQLLAAEHEIQPIKIPELRIEPLQSDGD